MMHGPINVNSPNNTSKWQMGFNSAFKGLNVSAGDFYQIRSTGSTFVKIGLNKQTLCTKTHARLRLL
jgi:hypothetical protein